MISSCSRVFLVIVAVPIHHKIIKCYDNVIKHSSETDDTRSYGIITNKPQTRNNIINNGGVDDVFLIICMKKN